MRALALLLAYQNHRCAVLDGHEQVEDRKIERNGACDENVSSGVGLNSREHHWIKLRALACVCITPFGIPVEPDVYKM